MRKLIIISAPSGSGKTTLCQRLLADFPALELSISSTTRAPRGQEKHGREYFFLKAEDFKARIAQGEFAEWAEVHGNFYGTSKKTLEAAFARGHAVLLDIDVQGADQLKKAYPKGSFLIFIAPPSLEVLEKRLRSRGTDDDATIRKRLKNAESEMARASRFDARVVNDDLEKAYTELKSLVEKQLGGQAPS